MFCFCITIILVLYRIESLACGYGFPLHCCVKDFYVAFRHTLIKIFSEKLLACCFNASKLSPCVLVRTSTFLVLIAPIMCIMTFDVKTTAAGHSAFTA